VGKFGKNGTYLHKLVKCLSKATDSDRKLLLSMAQKIAGGRSRRPERRKTRERAALSARLARLLTIGSYRRFARVLPGSLFSFFFESSVRTSTASFPCRFCNGWPLARDSNLSRAVAVDYSRGSRGQKRASTR